jgi:ATP-binding cassette, subfamily F, member 3
MLLQAAGVGMSFGADEIFSGLSFNINRGDRVALVGVNGAGKTTLLRILTGEIEPTSGGIHIARSARVAYLPQQMGSFIQGPLLESVCGMSGDAAGALDRMEVLHKKLSHEGGAGDSREILQELAEVSDLADATDAFNLKIRAERLLSGLGFRKDELEKPLEQFSGGWRMRAQLASLLLSEPDLLLLDEPTNHLDLNARIWLEEYLSSFTGAAWIISHDPGFLDRTVGRIAELEFGSMTFYTGNYSFYEVKKREEISRREKQAREQAGEIERLQKFIRRFKATESKRYQVRSREKMLERIEVVRTHRDPAHMKMRFPVPPRSAELVATLSGVSRVYNRTVFSGVDMVVGRGDRVGIVGRNGEGKSTLSRILAGVEPPTSGTFSMGPGVEVGFYTQEVDLALDPGLTLFEQLSLVSPGSTERELRSILGAFLFTGDDAFKPTGVLSGGERSRLALARILLSPVNFLILDEPTNHLDIFSRGVLLEALQSFTGTLVLISHDEQLLSALVQRVFEVGGGSVRLFEGDFDSYLRKAHDRIRASFEQKPPLQPAGPSPRELERERKRREAEERKERYRKGQHVRKKLERIEAGMAPLEKRRAELERLLSDPAVLADGRRIRELQTEHAHLSRDIQEQQELWEGIAEEMGEEL